MIEFLAEISSPWLKNGIIIAFWFIVLNIVIFLLSIIMVFYHTIYRNPLKKRTRECTNKKDQSQMRMFSEGISWAGQFKEKTEQLHIVNDTLNLYGEYINFGYDKCAVILQGRTESLLYSYYFAGVYAKNGYNILVMDVRAHGLSDGKYRTAGIKESDDLVMWIKLINEKYRINHFTLHGICVGAAMSVYTYIKLKNQGSDLIKSIVSDGLFVTNYEIFKNNYKVYKQSAFPSLYFVFLSAFILAKVRFFSETPIKYMKDIHIPILFIWSAKDIFCLKEKNEQLFEECSSKYKEINIFPEGRHSHVRSTQEADYDKVIEKFLKKNNL